MTLPFYFVSSTGLPLSFEMKKNHISSGVLINKGLHISLVDFDLKATRGVLVMMKGIWKKNLFHLQDSTIMM